MGLLEGFAALLLVIGSVLVLRAAIAADDGRADVGSGDGGAAPVEEGPVWRNAA